MVVPDVSLWLHGPKSGPADVLVLWRADLSESDLAQASKAKEDDDAKERPTAIVAAVRPSSLEAISLPFVVARNWLSEEPLPDFSDVEGSASDDSENKKGRLVLRWDGDDSAVISGDNLRPGDTIVVPASRGGIRDGCFDPRATAPIRDLAERAALFGRGLPVVRLHTEVLKQLGLSVPTDDVGEARAALRILANEIESKDWRKLWLEALAKSREVIVVEAQEPWSVLQGKRIGPKALRAELRADDSDTVEDGVEQTTDDDDSFHAGRSVTLSKHSTDVEHFARLYGTAAGLPPSVIEDIALAGWLHDIGKADRRFQVLLRGGSEIAFFKDETPWAKSAMPRGAKSAHRFAQKMSKYPRGARHEVQSVAMLESHFEFVKAKAHDVDLVLHLVASHHGHCRPFAPVVLDAASIDVALPNHSSKTFGAVNFLPTSSKHDLHRLDRPLADRFWRLVQEYGWQELCWLEAILRLADHRASEEEQSFGGGE
jgi:CRISPR-associated endonuclease/helicase Cas3